MKSQYELEREFWNNIPTRKEAINFHMEKLNEMYTNATEVINVEMLERLYNMADDPRGFGGFLIGIYCNCLIRKPEPKYASDLHYDFNIDAP